MKKTCFQLSALEVSLEGESYRKIKSCNRPSLEITKESTSFIVASSPIKYNYGLSSR